MTVSVTFLIHWDKTPDSRNLRDRERSILPLFGPQSADSNTEMAPCKGGGCCSHHGGQKVAAMKREAWERRQTLPGHPSVSDLPLLTSPYPSSLTAGQYHDPMVQPGEDPQEEGEDQDSRQQQPSPGKVEAEAPQTTAEASLEKDSPKENPQQAGPSRGNQQELLPSCSPLLHFYINLS